MKVKKKQGVEGWASMKAKSTSLARTAAGGRMGGFISTPLIVQKTWVIPPAAKNLKSFEPEGTGQGNGSRFPFRVQIHLVIVAAAGVIFQKISTSFAPGGHKSGIPLETPFDVNWMKHPALSKGLKSIFKSLALGLQYFWPTGLPLRVKKKQGVVVTGGTVSVSLIVWVSPLVSVPVTVSV